MTTRDQGCSYGHRAPPLGGWSNLQRSATLRELDPANDPFQLKRHFERSVLMQKLTTEKSRMSDV